MGLNHLGVDVIGIIGQINTISYCCQNQGDVNDWGHKQDLYRIKWVVEDALKRCPQFLSEQEWIREHDKRKVIRILSSDL
jgi:hypothetical protein